MTLIGFTLIAWLLIRSDPVGPTVLGERLSGPYFLPGRGPRGWRPLLAVALLLLFTLMSVRLDILLSYQGNEMYTALQQLDAAGFWRSIVIFAVLATGERAAGADQLLRGPAADHQLAGVVERAHARTTGWAAPPTTAVAT